MPCPSSVGCPTPLQRTSAACHHPLLRCCTLCRRSWTERAAVHASAHGAQMWLTCVRPHEPHGYYPLRLQLAGAQVLMSGERTQPQTDPAWPRLLRMDFRREQGLTTEDTWMAHVGRDSAFAGSI
jgi:hypothetical protein